MISTRLPGETGYYRVVGLPVRNIEQNCSPLRHGQFPTFSKRFLSVFLQDKSEIHTLKTQLNNYLEVLDQEIQLQTRLLEKELKDVESRINFCAQLQIIPKMHLQAWARSTRCELLEILARETLRLLQEKHGFTLAIIQELDAGKSPSLALSKYGYDTPPDTGSTITSSDNKGFFKTPEDLCHSDPIIGPMFKFRLPTLDSLCAIFLAEFRKVLPVLYLPLSSEQPQRLSLSPARVEGVADGVGGSGVGGQKRAPPKWRLDMLVDILKRYSECMAQAEPKNMQTVPWREFCAWYSEALVRQTDLERSFERFALDARFPEGRLLNRWLAVVLSGDAEGKERSPGIAAKHDRHSAVSKRTPTFSGLEIDTESTVLKSPVSHSSLRGSTLLSTTGSSVGSSTGVPHSKKLKLPTSNSPKAIIAFCKYFADQIISESYHVGKSERAESFHLISIPDELRRCATTLTEVTIFRRISTVTMRYGTSGNLTPKPSHNGVSSPSVTSDGQTEHCLLLRNDLRWRRQCQRFRLIDPTVYGMSKQFLSTVDERELYESPKQSSPDIEDKEGLLERQSQEQSTHFAVQGDSPEGARDSGTRSNVSRTVSVKSDELHECGFERQSWVERLPVLQYAIPHIPESVNKESPPELNESTQMSTDVSCQSGSAYCNFAIPYARSVRMLSLISTCLSPRHLTSTFILAIRWLHRDAEAAFLLSRMTQESSNGLVDRENSSRELIGADTLFPILVLVVANSSLPCIHLILDFIDRFHTSDYEGEAGYYLTSLEAAVAYIMEFEASDRQKLVADCVFGSPTNADTAAEIEYEIELHIKRQETDARNEGWEVTDAVMESIEFGQSSTGLSSLDTGISTPSASSAIVASQDRDSVDQFSEMCSFTEETSQNGYGYCLAGGLLDDDAYKNEEDISLEALGVWLQNQQSSEEINSVMQEEGWIV